VNKRERLLDLLSGRDVAGGVPAAFFLHFPPECHSGQAAIDKHVEYFRHTGMACYKIQYEFPFPHRPEIQTPDDWKKMPLYGREFYQAQLEVVEGLVKAARGEALVVQTLYSPFMSAGHTTSDQTITEHLQTDPDKVKRGLETITESILWFVRECIKLGIDGFYASTQGGEAERFADRSLFERYVKPYDLAILHEIDRACSFNILHVCDYVSGYDDWTPFLDYPGHIVNSPLQWGERTMTPKETSEVFGRPYMGGLDRHGTIVTGTAQAIRDEVNALLADAPERFILGADCTLPGDIDWDRIRTAIEVAHSYRR
jgi:uroporphyrinogen decarboxylase